MGAMEGPKGRVVCCRLAERVEEWQSRGDWSWTAALPVAGGAVGLSTDWGVAAGDPGAVRGDQGHTGSGVCRTSRELDRPQHTLLCSS